MNVFSSPIRIVANAILLRHLAPDADTLEPNSRDQGRKTKEVPQG